MKSMSEICVDNVSKAYGRRPAVVDLSLAVESGQLVALVGANGAGKTTTMAMLSGQLVPDTGKIMLAGSDVYGDAVLARSALGFVAQDLLLPPQLTLREMVAFGASVRSKVTDDHYFQHLLEKANLVDDADRLIGELSHGTQRKAAWVVALVHRPRVLLIDEGLAGLDATSCVSLIEEVDSQRRSGTAVLWTEHELDRFARRIDQVLVMRGGRIHHDVSGTDLERLIGGDGLDAELQKWTQSARLTK